MSSTWFDLAPPATWQRFEELCADTFAAEWRDPELVRYGRTGQKQLGVDILAAHGAAWPLGLQCKQKTRWPPKKLTTKDIDDEVAKAAQFTPKLKAFYILTTAETDITTTNYAANLTKAHKRKRLFPVYVIGWQEICRRATLHPEVARKHFGSFGGEEPAPLLATLTVEKGELAENDEDLQLSILHLQHDWTEFPNGRVVVRQKESEALAAELHDLPIEGATREQRRMRLELRDKLARLEHQERRVQKGLRLFLTSPATSHYVSDLWRNNVAKIVRNFVLKQLGPLSFGALSDNKVKLLSPKDSNVDVVVHVSAEQVKEVWDLRREHQNKYGKALTTTVLEMPNGVLSELIVPAILHRLLRCIEDDGLSVEQLRARGCLELGSWKVEATF